jgi:hypothetical protein
MPDRNPTPGIHDFIREEINTTCVKILMKKYIRRKGKTRDLTKCGIPNVVTKQKN